MKIKLITFEAINACPWFELHHPNMVEYAGRHGYTYVKDVAFRHLPTPLPQRVAQTRQLSDCDILVTLGGDTVVTNMTRRIEDVMPPSAHFAMVKETFFECDGVIVRNTPEGIAMMNDWIGWSYIDSWVWKEYGDFIPPCFPHIGLNMDNTTFLDALTRQVLTHEDVIPTCVCERYPEQAARIHHLKNKDFMVKHVHWKRGDFIMHVTGATREHRLSYMKMALENIVR